MIDAKTAAKAAVDYLRSMYENPTGVQVEEVELADDREHWYITLSFVDADAMMLPTYPLPRTYKSFKIGSHSGEVISMKIRDTR
jgi:hypothetical protein